MRQIPFPATILLLAAIVPPASPADGDWPMWRHDPALTGYQPTPGAMAKEPRIRRPAFPRGVARHGDLRRPARLGPGLRGVGPGRGSPRRLRG